MKKQQEIIIQTSRVSLKRYLWYLLILVGCAIFGLYLLSSMSVYQSETTHRTMYELFLLAIRNDGGLPFVALVIPACGVIAYLIVRALNKIQITVTDKIVYGTLLFGYGFNLALNKITNVEKISSTSLRISYTNGFITLRMLGNCDEIYIALTRKSVPAQTRLERNKQARITVLQQLTNDDLLTKMGSMQAAQRIAYISLIVLAAGCIIVAAIPFIEFGFVYGMSTAPAYLLLFLFVCLIFAYPLYYIITRNNDIFTVISSRASNNPEMANWRDILAQKRCRATKILVTIIVICPMIFGAFGAAIGGTTGDISPSEKMVTCTSCHREFKASSKNGKSISRRKMCELCYDNMKDMQDALDDWNEKNQ